MAYHEGDRVQYLGPGIQELMGEKGTIVALNLKIGGQNFHLVEFDNKFGFTCTKEIDGKKYYNTFECAEFKLIRVKATMEEINRISSKSLEEAYKSIIDSNYKNMSRWGAISGGTLPVQFYDDIIKPNKKPMSKIIEFFKNATLDADSKLLKELGLEDPTGEPTEAGLDLSDEISYKANRAEVITIAKAMKAEQDANKK